MGKLREESSLYDKLCQEYERKKDIDLELFSKCVDIAVKGEKREIKFILFKLKCLYEDIDTGSEKANSINKIIKYIAGDTNKTSFVITVLETALEEK